MSAKDKNMLVNPRLLMQALKSSFIKLNPLTLIFNPVIFLVEIGAAVTTAGVFYSALKNDLSSFDIWISIWLWITVIFANFSEALAEGRGKAHAESLRKNRSLINARRKSGSKVEIINATELKKGDLVVCEAGDIIPSDGEVVEGIASVDESVVTGESAPVIRESGGDRSAVTGGTRVISDSIIIRITSEPGSSFIDRIISSLNAQRGKKPQTK